MQGGGLRVFSGVRLQGLRSRVQGWFRLRAYGVFLGFRILGLGFRAQGLGFAV